MRMDVKEKKEIERIWKKYDRKMADPISISFDRFTVDGVPTCMAWYGSGGHGRMACFFIGTSHFGSQMHCMCLSKRIWPDDNNILRPVDGCPLWPEGDKE